MVGPGIPRRPDGRLPAACLIALFLGIVLSGCIVGYPDGSELPWLEVRRGDAFVYRLDGTDDEVRFDVGPTLYARQHGPLMFERVFLVTETTGGESKATALFLRHQGMVLGTAEPCLFSLSCGEDEDVELHQPTLRSGILFSSSTLGAASVDDGRILRFDGHLRVEREWRLTGVDQEVWRLEPVEAPTPDPTAPDLHGCDVRYHAITFHRDDLTPLTCETESGTWRLVERTEGRRGWAENIGYDAWNQPRADQERPSPAIHGDESIGPEQLTLGMAAQAFLESPQHQALEGTGDAWALWEVRLVADGEDCSDQTGCARRFAWRFTVARADGTSVMLDVVRETPTAADGPQLPVVGGPRSNPTIRIEETPGPAVPAVERLWGPTFAPAVGTFLHGIPACVPPSEGERSPCGFELRARHREGTVGYEYVYTTPAGEAHVYDPHLMERNPLILSAEYLQSLQFRD